MWRICALKRLLVGFKRERELLSFAKDWNIPTIVVFTHTQAEAGEAFVQESKGIIDEEWGFKGFVITYVRVNSVAFSFRGLKVPVEGLEELVDETKKCLIEAKKNKQNHFLLIQKANIQARKQAMIEECKTIIHVASGAAGAAGASPIPFSDMPIITGAQMTMIYKMNMAFEVSLDKVAFTTLYTGLLGFTAIGQTAKTIVANLIKLIPGAGSVVGAVISGTTAAVITEGIGFAYLKVLEKCFNDETGEVELPDEVGMITSLFKENYLNLDTIKKLTQ
ncbi:DUF697 domain-containing protein [Helicobacter pylori]|nr:DUF697 domain-containing protein [Helicobacter pylori]